MLMISSETLTWMYAGIHCADFPEEVFDHGSGDGMVRTDFFELFHGLISPVVTEAQIAMSWKAWKWQLLKSIRRLFEGESGLKLQIIMLLQLTQ